MVTSGFTVPIFEDHCLVPILTLCLFLQANLSEHCTKDYGHYGKSITLHFLECTEQLRVLFDRVYSFWKKFHNGELNSGDFFQKENKAEDKGLLTSVAHGFPATNNFSIIGLQCLVLHGVAMWGRLSWQRQKENTYTLSLFIKVVQTVITVQKVQLLRDKIFLNCSQVHKKLLLMSFYSSCKLF